MIVAGSPDVQAETRNGVSKKQDWNQQQHVQAKLGDPDAQARLENKEEKKETIVQRQREKAKSGDSDAQAWLKNMHEVKRNWTYNLYAMAKAGNPIAQARLRNHNEAAKKWKQRQREKADLGDPVAQAYLVELNRKARNWYHERLAKAKAGDRNAQEVAERQREYKRMWNKTQGREYRRKWIARRITEVGAGSPNAQRRPSGLRANHTLAAGDGTAESGARKLSGNSTERLAKYREEVEKNEWREKLERYWQMGTLGKLYRIQLYHTLKRMGYSVSARKKEGRYGRPYQRSYG